MRMQWREILYQIGIAVKEVLAVGSVYAAFCLADKQLVFAQQGEEIISSHSYADLKTAAALHKVCDHRSVVDAF